MPHAQLSRKPYEVSVYLAPNLLLLDTDHHPIGTYRLLAMGRIVAMIAGQVYAGRVAQEKK